MDGETHSRLPARLRTRAHRTTAGRRQRLESRQTTAWEGAGLSRFLLCMLALAGPVMLAQAAEPAASTPDAKRAPSLDDLYSDLNLADASISPSGRYLAVIARRTTDDVLVIMDLETDAKKPIQS